MLKRVVPCRLCNSRKTEPLITGGGTDREKLYHHCQDCDFIFVDDAFILSPEEEEKRYINHNNTIENEGYVRMFERFLGEAVEPEFEKAESVLDFGCGPGPVLAKLMELKGKRVAYYDPFYFPNEGLFNETYDLITSTEVFEHIRFPLVALQKLYNLLNKQSVLAIMTKFHTGTAAFEDWWYRRDVTHISFYSERTVDKLVERTAFSLLRTDGHSFFTLKK